ncbi:MAG TPA: hypothetical protein VGR94_04160 [Candidatus Acidoferrales bacterium]|nr:hypothetical protein [Candidatus Acidoferrales bacterium]
MPTSSAVRPALALDTISFEMRPMPPFRLDLTAWVLRRRPENLLDRWDGQTYRRALPLENVIVELAIQQTSSPSRPRLAVTAAAKEIPINSEMILRRKIEGLLGTQINLRAFYSLAASQKHLQPLIAEFAGFKPPRYPTIFEALLNAISCQQVSLHVGIMLLNRLVQTFGKTASSAADALQCCPSPEDLAGVSPGTLRAMGYSQQKERAILELSRSIVAGEINLESLNELDDASALARLTAIRGVGRWSAEYALLRGMGRLNIFPGDDVGGWNKLQKHLRLRKRPSYDKTHQLLAPWKSFAGLIYFHFLLDGLRDKGALA